MFAMGIGAMQGVVRASPLLAQQQDFAGIANLGSTDVLAVRLWLDKRVQPPTKSNVVARFDRGVGGTFFDLTQLQVGGAGGQHSSGCCGCCWTDGM